MSNAQSEIEQGARFPFGRNWASFLKTLDDSRIEIAVQSLRDLVQVDHLAGRTFLDVGSGSGLFSLAARKLGARVHSFDYDPQSVACTRELRERYFPGDADWKVESGSALDADYLRSLGQFDVVYSWGVLHHTGAMWKGLDLVSQAVADQGKLAIALYNDQGFRSRIWLKVKQLYCANRLSRWGVSAIYYPWFFLRTVGVSLVRRQNEFSRYRQHRGMSITHDWVDWLGGLPFEVASVPAVTNFLAERGFERIGLKATRRLGCNEFLFRKSARNEKAVAPN
ncbi:class I SAM-dependent methyltransferase [Planctomicrobium sp. SH664]|uniref:class I SAM-dependent methyltransferase n=1 Tax=Planctomicrobium sp. SH664 TaxID=3448125 RepID=UPI003F5BFE4E